jgi:predicted nucleic acid-binding protein
VRYLLDTDVAVSWLRGVERAQERVRAAAREGLGISYVSVAELYEGVHLSSDRQRSEQQLDDLLFGLDLVHLDLETAAVFGRERARLRRSGNIIADLDILIAASALRHNVTLLTNNRRDFERIEELTIESV